MAVSIEDAMAWELSMSHLYEQQATSKDVPLDALEPDLARATVVFAEARTRDWDTRRVEYQLRCLKAESAVAVPETWMLLKDRRIGKEFHGFTALPEDIRNTIYEEALTLGNPGVYMPTITYHQGKVRKTVTEPCRQYRIVMGYVCGPLGLVQGVCRLVQHEAMPVFLRQNRLFFPSGDPNTLGNLPRVFDNSASRLVGSGSVFQPQCKQPCEWGFSGTVREVSFAFDLRDSDPHRFGAAFPVAAIRHHIETGSSLDRDQILKGHETGLAAIRQKWAALLRLIQTMSLDWLQVDLQECYCPWGCCRLVDWVVEQLVMICTPPPLPSMSPDDYEASRHPPAKAIQLAGYFSVDERIKIMKELNKLPEEVKTSWAIPRAKGHFHIHGTLTSAAGVLALGHQYPATPGYIAAGLPYRAIPRRRR